MNIRGGKVQRNLQIQAHWQSCGRLRKEGSGQVQSPPGQSSKGARCAAWNAPDSLYVWACAEGQLCKRPVMTSNKGIEKMGLQWQGRGARTPGAPDIWPDSELGFGRDSAQ